MTDTPSVSTLERRYQKKQNQSIVAEFSCPICHDTLQAASETSCGHSFCAPCLAQSLKRSKLCPLCRKLVTNVHPSFVLRKVIEKSHLQAVATTEKSIRVLDRELQDAFTSALSVKKGRIRRSNLGLVILFAVGFLVSLSFLIAFSGERVDPFAPKPKVSQRPSSSSSSSSSSSPSSASDSSSSSSSPQPKKQTTKTKPSSSSAATESGSERLIAAAAAGDTRLVQQLLDSNAANVSDVLDDATRYTALHMASAEGMVETVKLLLERGAPIEGVAREFRTALHEAAAAGQLRVVKQLIQAGANVEASTSFGATPLWLAVQKSHRDVAEALLQTKLVNVNVQDMQQSFSPLHLAAISGDIDLAGMLLRSPNISVNLRAKIGWTPLYVAARSGHRVICKMLLDKGAMIESKSDENATPLYVATEYGQVTEKPQEEKTEVVRLLIERGANIEVPMASGATPLVIASQKGQRDMVRVLIDGGAHVDVSGAEKMNSLHLATIGKFQEIIRILLDAGINPDAQDTNGNTALHHAVHQNSVGTVSMLLRYGADFELKNSAGVSALELFRETYHQNGVFEGVKRFSVQIVPVDGETETVPVGTLLEVNNVVTLQELIIAIQRAFGRRVSSIVDEVEKEYLVSSELDAVLVKDLPRISHSSIPTLHVLFSIAKKK